MTPRRPSSPSSASRRTPSRGPAEEPAGAASASPTADAEAGAEAPRRRTLADGRQQVLLYLPPDMIKALKIAAVEQDSSVSQLVEALVTAWLSTASGGQPDDLSDPARSTPRGPRRGPSGARR